MLTVGLRSDNVTPEAHSICLIETALREYFFFGKEIYNSRLKMMKDLVSRMNLDIYIKSSTFPEYELLVFEFWMRTGNKTAAEKMSGYAEKTAQTLLQKTYADGLTDLSIDTFVSQSESRNWSRESSSCGLSHSRMTTCYPHELDYEMQSECMTFSTRDFGTKGKQFNMMSSANKRKHLQSKPNIVDIYKGIKCQTIREIKDKKAPAKVPRVTPGDWVEQSEPIVTFVNHEENENVGYPSTNHVFSTGDSTTETDLGLFLSRPVRIANFIWNTADAAGTTYSTIYPWKLFVKNQFNQLKFNNYSWFRGDLHIRIQMVASPFYYGMLKAIYTPLQGLRSGENYDTADSNFVVSISQRPHVDLEVGEADSFTMVLPFIYYKNYVNLQSAQDLEDLGKLYFPVYSQLRSVGSGASSGITINVYAWMENVELSGASVGYAAQGGDFEPQGDEYGEGCVSQPASWVAKAASYLEDIPIIGPFATATNIGATAIASIARLFGFTNVPVIEDTKPMQTLALPNMSTSEVGYPVQKLSLDPKNELSIDPRIVGINGVDEMAIATIACRESYLTQATLSTSNVVDDILFYSVVNPQMYVTSTGRCFMTPSCFVSKAFREWRGSMIFRFKVICSKYHKGKLRISYDPSGYTSQNLLNTSENTNAVHTVIVDLTETKDVEFVVPYQQAYQFLVNRNTLSSGDQGWATNPGTATFGYDKNYDNGVISVRVLTPLTAPTASSTVNMQVYVRAGPDIEFANPTPIDTTGKLSYFAPQSEDLQDHDQATPITLAPTGATENHQFLVHYGENIRSIRQLMRRMQLIQKEGNIDPTTASSYGRLEKQMYRMPISPGYISTGYRTGPKQDGTGSVNINFSNFSYISYFANAYVAYRGSVNWSFTANRNGTNIADLRIYKDNTQGTPQAKFNSLATTYSTSNGMAEMGTNDGSCGQIVTDQRNQPCLNACLPNFTRAKFQCPDPAYANKGIIADGSNADFYMLELPYPTPLSTTTQVTVLSSYAGIGADFSLMFFLNAPMLYVYTNALTPTA